MTLARLGTEPDRDKVITLGRDEAIAASVDELRRRFGSSTPFLGVRLETAVRRRLGISLESPAARPVTAITGLLLRLIPPLVATAVAGRWFDAPWGRWVMVAGVVAALEAAGLRLHPPIDEPEALSPGSRRRLELMTALVPALENPEDARRLALFARRWYTLAWSAACGAVIALVILGISLVVGRGDAHPGTVAMLALLLYDLGETTFFSLFAVPFMRLESRFPHRLFWLRPADSEEVQEEWRAFALVLPVAGVGVAIYMVLLMVLLPFDSPLLVPVAAGVVVAGYLTTGVLTVAVRASIRTIVERSRDATLAGIRARLDEVDPTVTSAAETEALASLYSRIRDAPTTPSASRAWGRAVAAVLVPTVVFVLTVFGEVYAEMLLEEFLD